MSTTDNEELEIESHTCPYCEKEQDQCACQTSCPICGGEMDPLDASLCKGCDSYYPECDCKKIDE